MDNPCTSPYPGFDSTGEYYTPRKAPRVRREAEEYAEKNAGSINLFSDEKNRHNPQGPPPSPRCMSREARDNYEKGRHGQVSSLLGGEGPAPELESVRGARVVKPEARETAELNKGGHMSELLTNDNSRPLSARRAPRIKTEASDTAEKARGMAINSLLHDPKALPETPRMKQRVTEESRGSATLGAGAQMAKVLFEYGTTPRSTRMRPRVTKEGQANADLNKGQVETIFTKWGTKSESARPPPMARKTMMSRLLHEIETLPSDPRKNIRAALSGRRICKKMNEGSINQIFSETSKWQIVPSPGVRGKSL